MDYYVGKICPVCKTEIKFGDAIKVCSSCGMPHHENCWIKNNGCTTYNCPGQNTEVTPLTQSNVCSNCGAPLAYGQTFCSKCGQRSAPAIKPSGTKSNNMMKIIIPAVIGVIAIIAVVLFFVLQAPSVEKITLSQTEIELREEDTSKISYTINPSDAKDTAVKWKSSDESVATVNDDGKITAKSKGTCTITATADGKKATVAVTVVSKINFAELYNEYCKSTWSDYGSDGSYLTIDTNPYDWDDDGLAYPEAYTAVQEVNEALDLPSSLLNDMGETTANDGKQIETYGDLTVSWKYHPDKGLEVTYKLK